MLMLTSLFRFKDEEIQTQSPKLPSVEPDIEEEYDYEDEIEDRHYLY
ncbi:hypothetical protein [Mesobacillus foraminis]|uniref:Uncharacterized protein n=1 Tax=Mesobacillus foraminis TaxID=279826 RepID=A0A4R2BB43_9BACI|nr:hypothetical protein [Mesobacillus foraminis]MBT2756686.1 hypothetical protein [Mesobacillus foraminis]TCN24141.1 hypothetical protein EV146_108255 [Mesobacillus foraminis]